MDTKTQIRTYFAKNILYSDSGFEYSDDASFLDEGIIDSSTTLELVLFIEETFGIRRPKQPYRAPIQKSFFGNGAPDYVPEILSPAQIK